MAFVKAVKHESKLRLAIAGPSGSGKTFTSLAIASALGGKVAVVDTEHGSASKYADLFEFDVMELGPPYHPDHYGAAIREAAAAGYQVVVLDSLTHAWNGTGGMLDLVDEIAKRNRNPNGFAAWKDATPIQNRLTESIVGASIHVIATMRSKQDYSQDKDASGKTVIKKVGMAPIQREGFEYEFDVFFDMDIENNAIVTKSRCPALTGHVYNKPGADVAAILIDWLQGAPAEKKPAERSDVETQIPAQVAEWLNAGNAAKSVESAKLWAVSVGAQENEHSAKASLKKIVDAHGGRLTEDNLISVLTAFLDRQLDKLQKMAEAAAVTVESAEPVAAF